MNLLWKSPIASFRYSKGFRYVTHMALIVSYCYRELWEGIPRAVRGHWGGCLALWQTINTGSTGYNPFSIQVSSSGRYGSNAHLFPIRIIKPFSGPIAVSIQMAGKLPITRVVYTMPKFWNSDPDKKFFSKSDPLLDPVFFLKGLYGSGLTRYSATQEE